MCESFYASLIEYLANLLGEDNGSEEDTDTAGWECWKNSSRFTKSMDKLKGQRLIVHYIHSIDI